MSNIGSSRSRRPVVGINNPHDPNVHPILASGSRPDRKVSADPPQKRRKGLRCGSKHLDMAYTALLGPILLYGATVPRNPGPPPRKWLANLPIKKGKSSGFGEVDVDRLDWKSPSGPQEEALRRAAQNQSRLSQQINAHMRRKNISTGDLATELGMSREHLLDILSGAAHVYLADLHRIGAVIGLPYLNTYDERWDRRRRRTPPPPDV